MICDYAQKIVVSFKSFCDAELLLIKTDNTQLWHSKVIYDFSTPPETAEID